MATVDHANPFKALLDRRVLLLALLFVAFPLAAYGLSYWLPTVVKGFGVSNTANGLLNIIPWTLVALALWWNPRHAERSARQESEKAATVHRLHRSRLPTSRLRCFLSCPRTSPALPGA